MANQKYLLLAIPVIVALLGVGLWNNSQSTELQQLQVNDSPKILGHVVLSVYDHNGILRNYVEVDNLIVDGGLDNMVDRVFGTSGGTLPDAVFDWLEIGTGSTFAPNATQTSLETPIGGCSRIQDASVLFDSAVSGETSVTVEGTFSGATCTGAIEEVGIFNNATSGTMLARSTFGTVTIGSSDSLNIEYKVTIT